jgi:hypothetical protein
MQLNYYAVLAAAVSTFVIGGLWYSPALFERRSWRYVAVNGGYWIVAFTVMGAILGAWR